MRKSHLKKPPSYDCVKLFSGIGVDVSISDIDIAHRVPQQNTTNSNGLQRRQPNSIILKFTRRLVHDKVLAARNNTSQLTVYNLELPSSATVDRIAIHSHLMPRLQKLLHDAKNHQGTYHYKWCWAKGAAMFLQRTDLFPATRLVTSDDLANLRLHEPSMTADIFCTNAYSLNYLSIFYSTLFNLWPSSLGSGK